MALSSVFNVIQIFGLHFQRNVFKPNYVNTVNIFLILFVFFFSYFLLFCTVVPNIKYCGKCEIALRGHDESAGSLEHLYSLSQFYSTSDKC